MWSTWPRMDIVQVTFHLVFCADYIRHRGQSHLNQCFGYFILNHSVCRKINILEWHVLYVSFWDRQMNHWVHLESGKIPPNVNQYTGHFTHCHWSQKIISTSPIRFKMSWSLYGRNKNSFRQSILAKLYNCTINCTIRTC